jgi:hypothetical protein
MVPLKRSMLDASCDGRRRLSGLHANQAGQTHGAPCTRSFTARSALQACMTNYAKFVDSKFIVCARLLAIGPAQRSSVRTYL